MPKRKRKLKLKKPRPGRRIQLKRPKSPRRGQMAMRLEILGSF